MQCKTGIEQIQTFNKLNILLSNVDFSIENYIDFTADFNLFPDYLLKAKGSFPRLLHNKIRLD